MDKWEYLTEFVWATLDTQGVKEYLEQKWPELQPDRFSPETMIPTLDRRGVEGWELVHMQPVSVGGNSDVLQFGTGPNVWTHIYFCVFKRRQQG